MFDWVWIRRKASHYTVTQQCYDDVVKERDELLKVVEGDRNALRRALQDVEDLTRQLDDMRVELHIANSDNETLRETLHVEMNMRRAAQDDAAVWRSKYEDVLVEVKELDTFPAPKPATRGRKKES